MYYKHLEPRWDPHHTWLSKPYNISIPDYLRLQTDHRRRFRLTAECHLGQEISECPRQSALKANIVHHCTLDQGQGEDGKGMSTCDGMLYAKESNSNGSWQDRSFIPMLLPSASSKFWGADFGTHLFLMSQLDFWMSMRAEEKDSLRYKVDNMKPWMDEDGTVVWSQSRFRYN